MKEVKILIEARATFRDLFLMKFNIIRAQPSTVMTQPPPGSSPKPNLYKIIESMSDNSTEQAIYRTAVYELGETRRRQLSAAIRKQRKY
jgi:hypothetical protein